MAQKFKEKKNEGSFKGLNSFLNRTFQVNFLMWDTEYKNIKKKYHNLVIIIFLICYLKN